MCPMCPRTLLQPDNLPRERLNNPEGNIRLRLKPGLQKAQGS
jgi:hypothetical protein